ncbi:MAG TPA: RusA family crossover junction endodeoxyribonuclease [Chloroflexi bacterium]|nr:RusA family crossover junction endodeoxyribonuclease [Chloroflexota bacterium]
MVAPPEDIQEHMGANKFGTCTFWVPGIPRPKGSYDILPRAGVKAMISRRREAHYRIRDLWMSPRRSTRQGRRVDLLTPWVEAIQWAALDHKPKFALDGPFDVGGTFYFPKPQTPRHKERVLERNYGDADKLIRAVGDALEHVFWQNDCQCEWREIERRWADKERGPGAHITITYLGEQLVLF